MPCGFTQQSDDSDDVNLWVPMLSDHHTMKADVAKYIMKLVSDIFGIIVKEECHAVLRING